MYMHYHIVSNLTDISNYSDTIFNYFFTSNYTSLVPRPRPKKKGKGLGTGERLLGLAGFGCARRHRQRSNKPRI